MGYKDLGLSEYTTFKTQNINYILPSCPTFKAKIYSVDYIGLEFAMKPRFAKDLGSSFHPQHLECCGEG